MEQEKKVDEGWKESAAKEKEQVQTAYDQQHADQPEFDFKTYVTSLAMQAVIFMGIIPNPLTEKVEKNIDQARMLIDTLVILREKTKGNLEKEEEDLLNTILYEVQMKFVEISNQP
ncbi:MAG: DUF1844 domain-containing protein [Candidatus Omnitrophota bacterium]